MISVFVLGTEEHAKNPPRLPMHYSRWLVNPTSTEKAMTINGGKRMEIMDFDYGLVNYQT